VYYSAFYKPTDGVFPSWFAFLLFIALGVELAIQITNDVSRTAFMASICDEKVGGTYISVLETVTSIGQNLPYTFALFLMDSFTWMECILNPFATTTTPASITVEPEYANSTVFPLYSNNTNYDFSNYTCYSHEKAKVS
jgi:hypothetical protein